MEAFLALDFFRSFCIKCFIQQGGGKKGISIKSWGVNQKGIGFVRWIKRVCR
jgi:hypothetical protein